MIFHQFFDPETCSYSYLVARRRGGEALLIDPVHDRIESYLTVLEALGLALVKAVDTHLHADHVTGLGPLQQRTGCLTVMGEMTRCECVDMKLSDGEWLDIDGMLMQALHTPGHTADSFCFLLGDRVMTGDTLLIGGTGRTDFPGGDAGAQYDSLHEKLLRLPEETLVFPGHDYKGRSSSAIGTERATNPRLQAASRDAYIAMMAELNLPPPQRMQIAVPANLKLGLAAAPGSPVCGGG